eukprot:TRINITY_DN2403_c0_g1_i1.p1 TRINITY_DN2403_c0_g1~~TRINITY_DN2403_c0_g1_i1.p1  ORF type:complete len:138 (-),score=23.19 TRINITY_DN2403_c0_g1_i1:140-553(-)
MLHDNSNIELQKKDGVEFIAWDVGGEDVFRPPCRVHWQKAKAFIFVIDSSDRDRLAEAHDEFHKAVYEQDIEHIPVLVLANKQDLPKCMSLQEVCQGLQLGALPFLSHGLWLVQGCCAITGQGLFEGLAWLASALHL